MDKLQTTNNLQRANKKPYDLEERTLIFAKSVIILCKSFRQNAVTMRLIGQLVAAAGSVGANYREATEALSKKDFIHRLKISRKECKETTFWLELLDEAAGPNGRIHDLIQESKELRNILTAILEKAKA